MPESGVNRPGERIGSALPVKGKSLRKSTRRAKRAGGNLGFTLPVNGKSLRKSPHNRPAISWKSEGEVEVKEDSAERDTFKAVSRGYKSKMTTIQKAAFPGKHAKRCKNKQKHWKSL